MNDFNRNMINALFNQDKVNDLLRKQVQTTVNQLLEAELTAFLGYDPYNRLNNNNSRNGKYYRKIDTTLGPIEVLIPRDRNGDFHQQTIPAYSHHTDALETTIIKLYSKGVTTREIADLIEKMYGDHYSPATVSNISKQMIPQVEAYHQRKLSSKFFCIYLDATYIPLRRATVAREAVYIAIGIKPNGHKEVLDYRIAPTENITVWSEMLQAFRQRGLKQVELFLTDGVVGIKPAINQYYPQANYQRCLVHIMRNICAKVRVSDRDEAMADFKPVHQQENKAAAQKVLQTFYTKWNKAYPNIVKDLQAIEPDLLAFYQYPKAIRRSIYSTNMIESFNNVVKRKVKAKAEFPNEQALDTFIGVQAINYNNRYFDRIHNGFGQVQDELAAYFN